MSDKEKLSLAEVEFLVRSSDRKVLLKIKGLIHEIKRLRRSLARMESEQGVAVKILTEELSHARKAEHDSRVGARRIIFGLFIIIAILLASTTGLNLEVYDWVAIYRDGN